MDASPDKIRSIYRKYQWQVFLGLVLGYAIVLRGSHEP